MYRLRRRQTTDSLTPVMKKKSLLSSQCHLRAMERLPGSRLLGSWTIRPQPRQLQRHCASAKLPLVRHLCRWLTVLRLRVERPHRVGRRCSLAMPLQLAAQQHPQTTYRRNTTVQAMMMLTRMPTTTGPPISTRCCVAGTA